MPVEPFLRKSSPEEQTPLLPGVKAVIELLLRSPERVDVVFLRKGRHSKDMERIADLCRGAGVRFALLDPPSFARVYAGNSQGVVARLYETGYVELEDLLARAMDAPLPLMLALDQVQDPGNAGTLARTLYALGGAGMIVPRHNGVYLGAAAAKAAAGTLDMLPVTRVTNLGHALESAGDAGYAVYGASSRKPDEATDADGGGKPVRDRGKSPPPVLDVFTAEFRLPAVLVLGGEENGLRPGTEKRCGSLLRIPLLRDCDSLNVAQAGGILISCFARAAKG
jgi:23S rRNA (guanosine2251-2'-O)-methyltransferase